MDNNNNKSKWIYRDEVKFWIIITSILFSVLASWYATKSDVILIRYRVNEIEKARAEVWIKQEEINKNQTALLNKLNTNLEVLMAAYKKNGIIK